MWGVQHICPIAHVQALCNIATMALKQTVKNDINIIYAYLLFRNIVYNSMSMYNENLSQKLKTAPLDVVAVEVSMTTRKMNSMPQKVKKFILV